MKLPKSESLILLAFIGCVAVWAISKCSAVRSDAVRRVRELTDEDSDDRPPRRDTVVLTRQPVPASPAPTVAPVNTERPGPAPVPHAAPSSGGNAASPQPARPGKTPAATPPPPTTANSSESIKYSTLYVTIDGLKLRKEPSLKGAVVAALELYEPVQFLNKKSEKTEEISLGYEKVTDHWVKVRTKSGKEGWVFGAGVHYYKMKRKGVME